MENQDQENTKPKTATENPKPEDEVQLTIETVTPDTHQSVPETAVNSEETEMITEGANDNRESNSAEAHQQLGGVNATDAKNQEDKEQGGTEEAKELVDEKPADENSEDKQPAADENDTLEESSGAQSKDNGRDGGDDERDKIETVAP